MSAKSLSGRNKQPIEKICSLRWGARCGKAAGWRNAKKQQRRAGNNSECWTRWSECSDSSYSRQKGCLQFPYLGKNPLQSPSRPVRGNDLCKKTQSQRLHLPTPHPPLSQLARALLHRSHSSSHSASTAHHRWPPTSLGVKTQTHSRSTGPKWRYN